uniref:DNA-(apurinic or apyrimidinic site) lyase n=1 Tax=Anthurium amnicola TaxID=1678845 RepID=A0A1D1Y9E7_9ARAE
MRAQPPPSTLSPPRSPVALTKRRRPKPPSPPPTSPPSSTLQPPTPPLPAKSHPVTAAGSRTKRSLADPLCAGAAAPCPRWEPLGVPRSELCLPLTLPTGQTFRWRQTGPHQYTGVVGPHLLSLRQADGDTQGHVAFLLHGPPAGADAARSALRDYLNLGISLADMWRRFSESDARFAELARHLPGGARVLRQDPVECVLQFLCSSNNNIARIERMVGVLSSFGDHLGTVGGFDFHQFPSIDRLAIVSEEQLREAGFGYRAKYIVDTIKALLVKPGGGVQWLNSLRSLELPEVIDALCTLPGVGPKVAACIALFSLDQHHAIPVDTHVWQIATRYLVPELAGSRLSPKLFGRVSEAFVTKFGKYAGWAQTVLFIGELPSQKALLPSHLCTSMETRPVKKKYKKARAAEVSVGSE